MAKCNSFDLIPYYFECLKINYRLIEFGNIDVYNDYDRFGKIVKGTCWRPDVDNSVQQFAFYTREVFDDPIVMVQAQFRKLIDFWNDRKDTYSIFMGKWDN